MLGEWFYRYLLAFVGEDAANALENCEEFVQAVEDDVKETSAYSDTGEWSDDDVRLAVGRVMMSAFNADENNSPKFARVCEVFTIEPCPNCGGEEVIWAKGVTRCPDCGAPIAPCSLCENCNYVACPYGCDGSENDLKKPITKPDISREMASKLYKYL